MKPPARPLRPALAMVVLLGVVGCGGGDENRPGKGAGEVCKTVHECEAGLVCLERTCSTGAAPAPTCSPPGKPRIVVGDVALPADEPGRCVLDARPSVLPATQVQDLGDHGVGTRLTFDIPRGTASFTIVSQETGDHPAVDTILFGGTQFPNYVVPTDIRTPGSDPTARPFFDDLAEWPRVEVRGREYFDTTTLMAFYVGFSPVAGSMTIPNTAAALDLVRTGGEVPPGQWSFTVNDVALECLSPVYADLCSGGSTTGRYHVQVLTRPGPLRSTGTLDIDLYLATDRFRAGEAPSDPDVRRYVATLSELFGRAGICLGEVRFHDLPAWAKARYQSVDLSEAGPCGELSQLFTLATAGRGLHLFLVDEFLPAGSLVLGIDGSIPGPSGVPGTINSGAVVLMADFGLGTCGNAIDVTACGNDRVAYITAHEAGHWLGLYHTTEREGSFFDPLTDTQTCVCNVCAPNRRRLGCAENEPATFPVPVSASWCTGIIPACGGSPNLMFWAINRFSRGDVTRQQGEVMRANPAVHE